jgi:beta-1,4-mannosyl-glycoprotein beta-1,4-N-acetylglucosaminyltransferase
MVMTYQTFKNNSFCEMRQNKQGIFVDNAGWHFTYMGGREAVRNKIESFGEQSLNLDWVKNGLENSINNAIERGRDLYNRPCKFWIEPISYETHPKYLVENQDKFSAYIRK